MKKYICDRCRREITDNIIRVNATNTPKKEGDFYVSSVTFSAELCEKCAEQMRKLIEFPQRGDIQAWKD